jgi:phosphoglycerol transferase MdoB-like AlkP superfamily enzyme
VKLITKNKFSSRVPQLGKRLILLLAVYFFLRILFLYLNFHQYGKFSASDLASSFLMGIRFDLSAILLINSPLIVLALLPKRWLKNSNYNFISHWGFLIVNIPFLLANLADVEYYKFTGRRITIDVFAFQKEAAAQIDQFIVNYWHLMIITASILVCLIYFSRRWHVIEENLGHFSIKTLLKKSLVVFLVLLTCLFGIRGGFQKKVLNTAHAYMLGHAELGTLALNSSFTLLQSYKKKNVKHATFFENNDLAIEKLTPPIISLKKSPEKINVVLIVLESFATEFWGVANNGQGYTPFLDSLASKGTFLKNNFANGRRSMEAMTSILFNTPSLISTPIAVSSYQQNTWSGLGSILLANGYHTSFFHGAPKGTMFFDAISAMAGLTDYYPLERYPHKGDFDENWGIYDEPFLQYMIEQLKNAPQPFFSMVFTISTHQPYHVPPQYAGKFRKGPLQIHESVGYVDFALKKYFEAAEKMPWYKNTLFVITGDHTQMSASENYNTSLGGFMVPLLLYHPGKKLPINDANRVTQHADIAVSILDYLGINDVNLTLFGHSVFDTQTPGEALLHLDENYWLVNKDYFLHYIPAQDKTSLFSYEDKEQLRPISDKAELSRSMKIKTQAYIQYFRNSLIDNSIYHWRNTKHASKR